MERRVTTQDISWFLDLRRNKQLDLDPRYQRRSVWSPRDRRFFLDTIFNGYPSPAIFVHKVLRDGTNVHEVVDGKQRLETIFLFVDNRLAIDKEFGDARLNGKKWRQIEGEPDLRSRFWDYVIPVEFLRVVDGRAVNEVFDRLNRNSRRLQPQELRHARYDGWLASKVEAEVDLPFWRDVGVVTTARSKRMRDVQFIAELLMIVLRGRISGFDQEALDELYAEYELPEDVDAEFDFEQFNVAVEGAKSYLTQMAARDARIVEWINTFGNFYTLWGVVALERANLVQPEAAATIYADLMSTVYHLKGASDPEALVSGEEPESLRKIAFAYLNNVTGAHTEPPQRHARHNILLTLLRSKESRPDGS